MRQGKTYSLTPSPSILHVALPCLPNLAPTLITSIPFTPASHTLCPTAQVPQPANFGSLRRFFPECSVIGYQRMVNPSDGPAVNPGDGPAPNPSSSTWLGAEVAGEQQLSPRFANSMGTGAAPAAVGGKQDGAAAQGQYRMLLNPEDSDEMQVRSTGEGTGWLMLSRREQAVGVGTSGGGQMQEPLLTGL